MSDIPPSAAAEPETRVSETRVFWHDSPPPQPFPTLRGARHADVAVIGGGIVGLTTALMLGRSGLEVVVLEGHRIARQATAASTAKVTALHGLIHSDLLARFGPERARLYAEANQWAVEHLVGLAGSLGDVGLRRADAFTYATAPGAAAAVEREAEAAARLGLPAEVVHDSELPFPILAAVRLPDQVEVDPVRLLRALAGALTAEGVAVHEDCRVVAIEDGQPLRLRTASGATVGAAHVVVATHLPVLLRGAFFAKTTPRRRPCLAATVDGPRLLGLHKSAGDPARSLRGAADDDGTARLIAIGEAFEPGTGDEPRRFRDLEDWTRRHFAVRAITHRWGNMDYHSADGVPYVGRLHRLTGGLWTATGFGAWGLSNGIAAARMLADAIVGRRNAWLPLFDATRLGGGGGGLGWMVRRNLHVGQMWAGRLRPAPAEDAVAALAPGEGKVVRRGSRKVGLARDAAGTAHAVAAICPHMGCVLGWNAVEQSWDCPCHGSRFAVDGTLLHGPAVRDLETFDAGGTDGAA